MTLVPATICEGVAMPRLVVVPHSNQTRVPCPLVSTSANLAGEPPAFTFDTLSAEVLAQVDGVLAGDTGGLRAPTAIRDAATGEELRAG